MKRPNQRRYRLCGSAVTFLIVPRKGVVLLAVQSGACLPARHQFFRAEVACPRRKQRALVRVSTITNPSLAGRSAPGLLLKVELW